MDNFLSLAKSACLQRGFEFCRAVEYLAEGMYREGYTVNEFMTQVEIRVNVLNNFS